MRGTQIANIDFLNMMLRKVSCEGYMDRIGRGKMHRGDLCCIHDRGDKQTLCNSYTMGCPPVRGDNPRALASGLSYVQVDKHGIIILYHLHQCRPCTSSDISN